VPLFLLGLVHALRRRSGWLLVLWVLLTALGNSLILFNNWTARFVVVMPAIAILCAVWLRCTWEMVWGRGEIPHPLRSVPSPYMARGLQKHLCSPLQFVERGRG